MLPIVKPYQAKMTYAGEPIDAYSKLIDSIGNTFDKTKGATNSLDIALSQLKFLDGDAEIGNKILNNYKESINNLAKDAAGNTRYDKAYNQVENLMVDFAKNTHLQHLGKNWAAAEEDRKKLADGDFNTKYIGVDNTKNFRSFNPDGTLNNYKSGIETRLDHEKAAARIIEQVAPEVVNSVEGLSEQEKQMIGSQGLYKFVTTEKKDSDTYKKVWNHIRNVAKSTPELDQYLRFKGEDALDNLLMNEGLLRQYKAEKVDIQNSPTVSIDKESIKEQALESDYINSFVIEPVGPKKAGTKQPELLPEDAKSYDRSTKSIYIPNAPAVMGGLASNSGVNEINPYNKNADEVISKYQKFIPELKGLTKPQAAKIINAKRAEFDQELNTKYGHSDIVVRNSTPVVPGSKLDIDGVNIKSQDSNVVLLNGDRKDKASLKQKFEKADVNFNFEKPVKSTFMGVNISMDGNAHSNGGYIYLLEDADGNKQEVIKYDDNFNKKLKPVNEIFTRLHSLARNTDKEQLKTKTSRVAYTTINTENGSFQARPLIGNLREYKLNGNTAIPDVGEGVDTRIEAKGMVRNASGQLEEAVSYYTAEQFQQFMARSLVKEPSFRNNFKKPNID